MLAQTLQSADDLGLNQPEYNALRQVLSMLERNELQHAEVPDTATLVGPLPINQRQLGLFNMATWAMPVKCGTACCIKGVAEIVLGRKFVLPDADYDSEIEELFCPAAISTPYVEITVEQAARALRNYLSGGEVRWEEVLDEGLDASAKL